jgi:hyperosmotically inducible periplasmic protein
MMRISVFRPGIWLLGIMGVCTLLSCKGKVKDSDIASAITNVTSAIPGASSVTPVVNNGDVTISGAFPSDSAKSAYDAAVKAIKGVNSVTDNASVAPPPPPQAPVVISGDSTLIRGVADATKDFPSVQTSVSDGVVTLTGDIKRTDLQKLMESLHSLRPKKVVNNLTIK